MSSTNIASFLALIGHFDGSLMGDRSLVACLEDVTFHGEVSGLEVAHFYIFPFPFYFAMVETMSSTSGMTYLTSSDLISVEAVRGAECSSIGLAAIILRQNMNSGLLMSKGDSWLGIQNSKTTR